MQACTAPHWLQLFLHSALKQLYKPRAAACAFHSLARQLQERCKSGLLPLEHVLDRLLYSSRTAGQGADVTWAGFSWVVQAATHWDLFQLIRWACMGGPEPRPWARTKTHPKQPLT